MDGRRIVLSGERGVEPDVSEVTKAGFAGRRPGAWLGIYARGAAMGIAELVPGVSGGTIAFITGIYLELVRTLRRLDFRLARLLLKGRFRDAWTEGNLGFLVVLGAGMGTSILAFASLVAWLLENRELQVWGFFFGLIAASAIFVGRFVSPWTRPRILLAVLGMAVGAALGFVSALAIPVNLGTVFLGGMVAICAWILPGISGSFMLLLLGQYPTVVRAISELDLLVLGALAAGCATGILVFARVLVWLLRRFYEGTLALLCGFMVGALVKIWPWRAPMEGALDAVSKEHAAAMRPVSPTEYGLVLREDPMVAAVLVSVAIGVTVVIGLDWMARTGQEAGRSPGALD